MRLFGHSHGCHHGERYGERFVRGPHFGDSAHERRHHGFGRGGRLARLLEHGDLRTLILHLVNEKPRHGYEIIKAVEDLTGGAYAPSPGVIYPTLTMLEELGHVEATTEGTRKSFAITEAGKTVLEENRTMVDAILARLNQNQPRDAAMPVFRAMENLKNALRMKLGARAAASAETMRKIADTLDAVARDIEEL